MTTHKCIFIFKIKTIDLQKTLHEHFYFTQFVKEIYELERQKSIKMCWMEDKDYEMIN